MQHDEMIWNVINNQFCSFQTTLGKAKSEKQNFCKHPYSVTGLCNRTSCPLANSKYATLREENGKVFLYMKSIERAHSPKNLWEKVILSRNYSKALEQIDQNLQFYPKALVHRNKQRLTKIHQYLLRMRKIKLKQLAGQKAKYVRVHRKVEQREARRERKALVAAKIEKNIEKELIERLAQGTYGDIYNYPEAPYIKALKKQQEAEDGEKDKEEESETESELETEDETMDDSVIEYVEDFDASSDEEEEDIEDIQYLGDGQWGEMDSNDEDDDDEDGSDDSDDDDGDSDDDSENKDSDDDKKKKKKKKKDRKPPAKPRQRGPRVEIEYEHETESNNQQQMMEVAGSAW